MRTENVKKLFLSFLGFAFLSFFTPVVIAVISSDEAMSKLGLCAKGDWECILRYAFDIAFSIIFIGAIICGIILTIVFIVDSIKWRNFITPIENFNDRKKPYISVSITNKEKHSLKFYCVLKSIVINGNMDTKMTNRITEHTSRVSWSGGSDEDVGIKSIDGLTKGTLNIVSLNGRGLAFEMAKGERSAGMEKGVFILNMELYREVENNKFKNTPFTIMAECYTEPIPVNQQKWAGMNLIGPLLNYGVRLVNGGNGIVIPIKIFNPNDTKEIIVEEFNETSLPMKGKLGITIYNPFLEDFTNIEIELIETHWIICDENRNEINKIISQPSKDNCRLNKWANTKQSSVKGEGHEVVYFAKKINEEIAFLLEKDTVNYDNSRNYFHHSTTDTAITYFELMFEIRGVVGENKISKRYKAYADYISNKIYPNVAKNEESNSVITYAYMKEVKPI